MQCRVVSAVLDRIPINIEFRCLNVKVKVAGEADWERADSLGASHDS